MVPMVKAQLLARYLHVKSEHTHTNLAHTVSGMLIVSYTHVPVGLATITSSCSFSYLLTILVVDVKLLQVLACSKCVAVAL